jgi:hypothetical protein
MDLNHARLPIPPYPHETTISIVLECAPRVNFYKVEDRNSRIKRITSPSICSATAL